MKAVFTHCLHSQSWILHINEFLYKCLGFYTNPIPLCSEQVTRQLSPKAERAVVKKAIIGQA